MYGKYWSAIKAQALTSLQGLLLKECSSRSCSVAAAKSGEETSPEPPRCSQVDTVLVAACTADRYRDV